LKDLTGLLRSTTPMEPIGGCHRGGRGSLDCLYIVLVIFLAVQIINVMKNPLDVVPIACLPEPSLGSVVLHSTDPLSLDLVFR
jgi:hypothetical protein